MEQYLKPADIAKLFGVSTEYVRMACYRKKGNTLNRLNVKTGNGRNYFRIRPSEFKAWLEREEHAA